MAATKTGYPWLTRAEAATLIGLGTKQLDDAIRPRLPKGAEKGMGKKLRVEAAALVATLIEYRLSLLEKPIDGDPLMADGGDSPWLEEYRKQKAGQEQIKLRQMRVEVIPLEELEPVLTRYGATLRQTAATLQRRFGPDAATIYNEGVDEAIAAAESYLTDARRRADAIRTPPPGNAQQDTPPADDAGVRGAGDKAPKRPARRSKVQRRPKPVRGSLV